MNKVFLSHHDVLDLAREMADNIQTDWATKKATLAVYPVPRGGVPVAYALAQFMEIEIVSDINIADICVDDIIDSGATRDRIEAQFSTGFKSRFYALIDKPALADGHPYKNWIEFPWEVREDDTDESVTDNVVRLLQHIGEDPTREGLLETPARFIKAFKEKTQGYAIHDPKELLKTFEDGNSDELVVVKGITFDSMCEHHLERISGTVSIGYIPNGAIVGLSKFVRLTDAYAQRLQVQERLTTQIADAIDEKLKPKGVAVVVEATHGCMECRGVRRHGAETITSALRGVFVEGPLRAEFMGLLR